MNKPNLTVMVLKDFDPNNIEETMKPENVDMLSVNPKHVIVITSDGVIKPDGTIDIFAHVQGEKYDILSRMFMLTASKIYEHFVNESKKKEGEEK